MAKLRQGIDTEPEFDALVKVRFFFVALDTTASHTQHTCNTREA
jgi:hypothetical protein